jgi:hypothetical protein
MLTGRAAECTVGVDGVDCMLLNASLTFCCVLWADVNNKSVGRGLCTQGLIALVHAWQVCTSDCIESTRVGWHVLCMMSVVHTAYHQSELAPAYALITSRSCRWQVLMFSFTATFSTTRTLVVTRLHDLLLQADNCASTILTLSKWNGPRLHCCWP